MSNNNNDEDKPDRNLVNVEKADDTVNSDVVDDKTVGQAVGESDEKLVANDVSGADEEDEDDCQEEEDKMKFLAWVQSRFGKSIHYSSNFIVRTPLLVSPSSSSRMSLSILCSMPDTPFSTPSQLLWT